MCTISNIVLMMLLVKNKQVDVNGLLYFMLIKFSLSIPRGGGGLRFGEGGG